MPFYEYECQACKFYTEVMQKISEAPLSKCPSCGKRTLKKLVSAPVFRLKGGGWYETDFKSEKEQKRNLSGVEKEEPKAEAKPAEGKAAEGKAGKAGEAAPAAGKEAKAAQAPGAPRKSAAGAETATRRAPTRKARASRARRTRLRRR